MEVHLLTCLKCKYAVHDICAGCVDKSGYKCKFDTKTYFIQDGLVNKEYIVSNQCPSKLEHMVFDKEKQLIVANKLILYDYVKGMLDHRNPIRFWWITVMDTAIHYIEKLLFASNSMNNDFRNIINRFESFIEKNKSKINVTYTLREKDRKKFQNLCEKLSKELGLLGLSNE